MDGSDVPPWRTMILEGGQFFGALAVGDGVFPPDAGSAVEGLDALADAVLVAGELLQFAEVSLFFRRGFAEPGFFAGEGCCVETVDFEDFCELGCD